MATIPRTERIPDWTFNIKTTEVCVSIPVRGGRKFLPALLLIPRSSITVEPPYELEIFYRDQTSQSSLKKCLIPEQVVQIAKVYNQGLLYTYHSEVRRRSLIYKRRELSHVSRCTPGRNCRQRVQTCGSLRGNASSWLPCSPGSETNTTFPNTSASTVCVSLYHNPAERQPEVLSLFYATLFVQTCAVVCHENAFPLRQRARTSLQP